MRTVFLFIPSFVFSSDLLRTNYIKYLTEKYRVVVFSPIFKLNSPENYYQSPNVKYVLWEEANPQFWLFFTKTLRIALIREFDALNYFKLRRLMKINLNWQRKLLRAVSWFLPRPFLTADFFTWLETKIVPVRKDFLEHISTYKPALVMTCTPGFSSVEAEAIIMCKKLGIKTAAVNSSWDNYTSNATQLRKTDYLISWNNVMKREAIKIHRYPENKLFVSGVYRFDHHFAKYDSELSRDEFLRSKGLDPKLKTLLLSTVPPNTYPPQYDVLRTIVAMRDKGQLEQDVNIFIRLHPNDIFEKYKDFIGMKNVHVELAGHAYDAQNVNQPAKIEMDEDDLANLRYSLKYTDININFRSSLSLEATIYDKPIINLALNGYNLHYQMDHYLPILESGGVKLVKTTEELKNVVKMYLDNPALDGAGRKKIFDDYIGFNDGLSYKRGADALAEMI